MLNINHQNLDNMELVENLKKFLTYLSCDNDHSIRGFDTVLLHYLDPRLMLKRKNIHPGNFFGASKISDIVWAASYIELHKENERFRF